MFLESSDADPADWVGQPPPKEASKQASKPASQPANQVSIRVYEHVNLHRLHSKELRMSDSERSKTKKDIDKLPVLFFWKALMLTLRTGLASHPARKPNKQASKPASQPANQVSIRVYKHVNLRLLHSGLLPG